MYTVCIVGKPNVGKSTLFNRLAGERKAIIDDMPGVTRDYIEATCSWIGRQFRIIDTAGFDLTDGLFKKEMKAMFEKAISIADKVVLLGDAVQGIHPLEEHVAQILREQNIKFIVAVNKCDNRRREMQALEYHALGVDNIINISASHSRNIDELLDELIKDIPTEDDTPEINYNDYIKIAIVGKPNVGKSSILNKIFNEERVIVSPQAGTTRDAVDVPFSYNGKDYLLIDTAGIHRKSVMFKDVIEKYGYYRSIDAIDKADVAVCIVDATAGISELDVKVIGHAWDTGRSIVLVLNKWDITDKDEKTAKRFYETIEDKLRFLHEVPIIFASAVTGKNVNRILQAVDDVYKESTHRIKTRQANEILRTAITRHAPPVLNNNRRLKFYYMTQVSVNPPTFAIFVNFPDSVHETYERFIKNTIREFYSFDGTPIRILLRQRTSKQVDKTAKPTVDDLIFDDNIKQKVYSRNNFYRYENVDSEFDNEHEEDFDNELIDDENDENVEHEHDEHGRHEHKDNKKHKSSGHQEREDFDDDEEFDDDFDDDFDEVEFEKELKNQGYVIEDLDDDEDDNHNKKNKKR